MAKEPVRVLVTGAAGMTRSQSISRSAFSNFFFFIVRYAYHHCLIGRIVDIWF